MLNASRGFENDFHDSLQRANTCEFSQDATFSLTLSPVKNPAGSQFHLSPGGGKTSEKVKVVKIVSLSCTIL